MGPSAVPAWVERSAIATKKFDGKNERLPQMRSHALKAGAAASCTLQLLQSHVAMSSSHTAVCCVTGIFDLFARDRIACELKACTQRSARWGVRPPDLLVWKPITHTTPGTTLLCIGSVNIGRHRCGILTDFVTHRDRRLIVAVDD